MSNLIIRKKSRYVAVKMLALLRASRLDRANHPCQRLYQDTRICLLIPQRLVLWVILNCLVCCISKRIRRLVFDQCRRSSCFGLKTPLKFTLYPRAIWGRDVSQCAHSERERMAACLAASLSCYLVSPHFDGRWSSLAVFPCLFWVHSLECMSYNN